MSLLLQRSGSLRPAKRSQRQQGGHLLLRRGQPVRAAHAGFNRLPPPSRCPIIFFCSGLLVRHLHAHPQSNTAGRHW